MKRKIDDPTYADRRAQAGLPPLVAEIRGRRIHAFFMVDGVPDMFRRLEDAIAHAEGLPYPSQDPPTAA